MTSPKPTSERRSSLFPPRTNVGSPNAAMVLAANVPINLIKHNRQRDQQTEPAEVRIDHLNQQRHSLAQAIDVINTWKQRDSMKNSSNTDQSTTRTQSRSATQNSSLDAEKNKSTINYFYKRP